MTIKPTLPSPVAKMFRVCLLILISSATACQSSTAIAQRLDQAQRRAPRPDWSERDTSDIFFKDVISEAFGGHWPPAEGAGGTETGTRSTQAASSVSTRTFVWSKAVDPDLLVDEIKRVTLVVRHATRSKSTWGQYGSDKSQADLATLAVLFRVISEWEGEIRFKSEGLAMSRLLSQAVRDAENAPASALSSARAVTATLQDLVDGNRVATEHSGQQPSDWGATVDRAWLMARLELAIDSHVDSGLHSPAEMSRRSHELRREANLSTVIFGALCRDGCEDADQVAYVAHCKSAARSGVAIRRAVADGQYVEARRALAQLRDCCVKCHEEFRF